MRLAVVIGLIVILLGGSGYFAINFLNPPPAEVAEDYLDLLVERKFSSLVGYFHSEYPQPTSGELARSFAEFASAFNLSQIELVGFNPIEETLMEAEYQYELEYSSELFEPLLVQVKLELLREGLFDWKVKWVDAVPLPEYGLAAGYSLSRIEPTRGNIYDRNGQMLAGEGSVISIGVQPGRIEDPQELTAILQQELGLNPTYVENTYQAQGIQDHWFVPLATVSEEEYAKLNPVLRPIPGIFFRREDSRVYPAAANVGHITGYMGEVTQEMIDLYPERDYLAGERAGRSGLEFGVEDVLRGKPGYQFHVELADDEKIMLREHAVVDGQDVQLTLDLAMQRQAVEVLGGNRASLVVLDAKTGEVLVLASVPGYDPNEFIRGMSSARWQQLTNDPARPLFNRALQGRYPPGSVFKVLTIAAALDQGLYTPDSLFEVGDELVVEGNVIRNFEREVFAEHQLTDAVTNSINTTIAQVGLNLTADKLAEYFSRLQLDKQPDLILPAMAGQIGNPGRSKVGLAWSAIGQDQVLVTPFHVASLFSAIANEGVLPHFSLIAGNSDDDFTEVIKPQTAQEMTAMLERVVAEGTGKAAAVDGLKLVGKTGTAEVSSEVTHAWFAGFAQDFEGRDLSFALLVEEGGVGGRVAAPLVNQYFSKLLGKEEAQETDDELEDSVQ